MIGNQGSLHPLVTTKPAFYSLCFFTLLWVETPYGPAWHAGSSSPRLWVYVTNKLSSVSCLVRVLRALPSWTIWVKDSSLTHGVNSWLSEQKIQDLKILALIQTMRLLPKILKALPQTFLMFLKWILLSVQITTWNFLVFMVFFMPSPCTHTPCIANLERQCSDYKAGWKSLPFSRDKSVFWIWLAWLSCTLHSGKCMYLCIVYDSRLMVCQHQMPAALLMLPWRHKTVTCLPFQDISFFAFPWTGDFFVKEGTTTMKWGNMINLCKKNLFIGQG